VGECWCSLLVSFVRSVVGFEFLFMVLVKWLLILLVMLSSGLSGCGVLSGL